jgi:Na+-driven multidrug efflux pump
MAVLLATGICVVGFIIIMLFTSDIIGLFNSNDKALISNGVHAMRILIMAMPLAGYQIVTTSYFQAIGKAGKSVILTLSRNGLIIIPLLYILPNFFLLDGIWMTAPLSDFGSGALALVFFAFEIKRLKTRAVKNKKT